MQYDETSVNRFVDEFSKKRVLYTDFAKAIESLLKKCLLELEINDFSTKSRAKQIDSFRAKIQRKSYTNPLSDITDLSGVRIILCYTDQIEIVEHIIKNEFLIDAEKSIDKSKSYKPNTFGYLSNHFIVYNNPEKEKDEIWKKFNNLKAEIQVRTSLQDSWATVSHTLYKNESDVPAILFRRLNRLAGLFELADQEFFEIRSLNDKFISEIKNNYAEGKVDEIKINNYSIIEFINRSSEVIEAKKTARNHGILAERNLQQEYYEKIDCSVIVEVCKSLSINTIKDLSNLIRLNKKNNVNFIEEISVGKVWKVTSAFILFLLILKATYKKFPKDFLVNNYGWNTETVKAVMTVAKKSNDVS